MIKVKYIITLILATIFLYSCTNSGAKISKFKPVAISKANDVVIIADKKIWNSEVGDTLRYYFESAYPITPNPEPSFRLRYFDYDQIDAAVTRRQLRTYIVPVDLSDTSSKITRMFFEDIGDNKSNILRDTAKYNIIYGRDKWAKNQLIIYIVAKDKQNLIKAIVNNYNTLAAKIYSHDEEQIEKSTFFTGINAKAQSKIKEILGIKVKIPKDFKLAMSDEKIKLVWTRRDSKKAISNFVVQKLKYRDTAQFNTQNVIKLINEFGNYVTTDIEGSKLVVNDKDLPVLKFEKSINGNYAVEYRGIWEMTKDFMGGAFIAYLIKDKDSDDMVFALGFVYGPGTKKRDYLQQLMVIANTIDFLN